MVLGMNYMQNSDMARVKVMLVWNFRLIQSCVQHYGSKREYMMEKTDSASRHSCICQIRDQFTRPTVTSEKSKWLFSFFSDLSCRTLLSLSRLALAINFSLVSLGGERREDQEDSEGI